MTTATATSTRPAEIELIRESGRIAAGAVEAVAAAIRPGITTDELDAIAHDYIIARDAYPSTLQLPRLPQVVAAPR